MNVNHYPTRWPIVGKPLRYWTQSPEEAVGLSLILALLAIFWLVMSSVLGFMGIWVLLGLAAFSFLFGIFFLMYNERELQRLREQNRKKVRT